jgi:hypothetical protein
MNPVIFLDIDGVLECRRRPPADLSKTDWPNEPEAASKLDPHLVEYVQSHFDQDSCQRIRSLAEEFHADLVITSSWRNYFSLEQMQNMFSLVGLGEFVTGATPCGTPRCSVIESYIYSHDIDRYIVIDDLDMSSAFGFRFVESLDIFEEESYKKARRLLKYQ